MRGHIPYTLGPGPGTGKVLVGSRGNATKLKRYVIFSGKQWCVYQSLGFWGLGFTVPPKP